MNAPLNRKSIFDTVRHLLGRGFSQSEVDALDHALDHAHGRVDNSSQDSVTCVTYKPARLRVSDSGIALIKRFEGCAQLRTDGLIEAYPDPATGGAPWTIGWGATGDDIGPGTVWTQKECDARLKRDIARHAADVRAALGKTETTQGQFDALVSFHYNTGAIGRATLTQRHCAGDFAGAAEEFQRWNRAAGRVLKGLTRRRAEEERLYRSA